MKTTLLIILCFAGLIADCQNTIISGRVVDSITHEPISYVNIIAKDQKNGAVTNRQGKFSITLTHFPYTLVFSHVSFNTKMVVVCDSFGDLFISLSPRIQELPVAEVTAPFWKDISENLPCFVSDFVFWGDTIILLVFDETEIKPARLLLMNDSGKVLLSRQVVKADKLMADKIGFIYFVDKRFSWQILVDSGLQLLYPAENESFLPAVSSITRVNDTLFLVKRYAYSGQQISWFLFNMNSKQSQLMAVIENESGIRMLSDRPRLESGANEFELRFEALCMYKPIESQALVRNDTVFIVDFFHSCILFYSFWGDELGKKSFYVEKKKKLKPEIFCDEKTGNYYVVSEKNGNISIATIHLASGEIHTWNTLQGITSFSKIWIRDQKLYTLSKESSWKSFNHLYCIGL